MTKRDFHIHTTFSDGRYTPKELLEYAISLGMTHVGFSDHSRTSFDDSYCLSLEGEEAYKKEIVRLRDEYDDRIKVYLGIEEDYYSDENAQGYDYKIGSVHYVKANGEYLPVDKSAADLREAVEKHFWSDPIAFCCEYFRTVGDVVRKTDCDIIGHFDLCTKFNEKDPFIDERDPRYVAAWRAAVDRLIPEGRLFEINTGVIPRGYKSNPYPSFEIFSYIKEKGGRFILSSDSHKLTLCHGFEEWQKKYGL